MQLSYSLFIFLSLFFYKLFVLLFIFSLPFFKLFFNLLFNFFPSALDNRITIALLAGHGRPHLLLSHFLSFLLHAYPGIIDKFILGVTIIFPGRCSFLHTTCKAIGTGIFFKPFSIGCCYLSIFFTVALHFDEVVTRNRRHIRLLHWRNELFRVSLLLPAA